ncbi:MAG: LysR family transcriptional regulator [Myxococcales bacterium]
MTVDLAQLQIFKAVVEEGGVLKAARKLHRVPSNVTTRVKQLEETLGTELFVRERKRLFLSPAGELLLAYADRLLRLADDARAAVAGSTPQGVLRLGALESTTASRLPPVLAGYHRKYPAVRIELITGTNDALTAAVLDRRVDAAFVAEVPCNADLAHLPLFPERLTLISSLAHRRIRRPADVEGDSVVAFPNGCAYRRRLQRWLGPASTATRVLNLGSYHAIVACVASGAGIAFVPESVLDTVNGAQVRRHPVTRSLSALVTPLIWRQREESAALAALREELTAGVTARRESRSRSLRRPA